MESSGLSVAGEARRVGAALEDELFSLQMMVQAPYPAGLQELRGQLEEVLNRMTDHFRLEDQNGYAEAVRREPRLERKSARLSDEHPRLLRTLDALITEAASAARINGRLGNGVRAWIASVRRHEDRESRLAQEAVALSPGPFG